MDKFKGDFSQCFDFLHPQIPDFLNRCISAKYCPIITNHKSMESSFIQFQMMYKSILKKKLSM